MGISGSIGKKEIDVFNHLLVVDQLRGPHSTGAGSASRGKGELKVIKALGTPEALFAKEDYDKVITFAKEAFIGHNRFATVGDKNESNAHPFIFENPQGGLIGAHNGTIFPEARKRMLDHEKFGTDSAAIFHTINEVGITETVKELEGAWAFTYYDQFDHTINFLRNKERPLHFAYSENKEQMYWSSELGILQFVLERLDVKIFENFYKCMPDKLYTFDIPDWSKKFDPCSARDVKGYERKWSNRSYGDGYHGCYGYNGEDYESFDEIGWQQGWGRPLNDQHTRPPWKNGPKEPVKDNVILLSDKTKEQTTHKIDEAKAHPGSARAPGADSKISKIQGTGKNTKKFYIGYQKEHLDQETFEERTKNGCQFCSGNVFWGQTVRFLNKDEVLCTECLGDVDVLGLIP